MLIAMILICPVALLLSFEYKGERYHTVLWVLRGISVAVALATAAGMLIPYPRGVVIALGIAAIGVNLPLAVTGLKKK